MFNFLKNFFKKRKKFEPKVTVKLKPANIRHDTSIRLSSLSGLQKQGYQSREVVKSPDDSGFISGMLVGAAIESAISSSSDSSSSSSDSGSTSGSDYDSGGGGDFSGGGSSGDW